MDSLQMIEVLESKGMLTKQASHRLRLQRQQIFRAELTKEAGKLGRLLADAKDAIGNTGKAFFGSPAAQAIHSVPRGPAAGTSPWSMAGANILKLMALAGGAAGASAGINTAIRHGRDKKLNAEIESSYGSIVNEAPELKRFDDANPGRLRKHFEVLARYAPSLAANPVVAAGVLRETMTGGTMQMNTIKMLTDIQGGIDRIHDSRSPWKESPISKHVGLASAAMSGRD